MALPGCQERRKDSKHLYRHSLDRFARQLSVDLRCKGNCIWSNIFIFQHQTKFKSCVHILVISCLKIWSIWGIFKFCYPLKKISILMRREWLQWHMSELNPKLKESWANQDMQLHIKNNLQLSSCWPIYTIRSVLL